eukprot:COSAG02_NODE_40241_length_407_cov_1.775974_1_plen_49_part_10
MNYNNVQRYYTITLLLSALPVSTMSAPGTPDSEAAPGYKRVIPCLPHTR